MTYWEEAYIDLIGKDDGCRFPVEILAYEDIKICNKLISEYIRNEYVKHKDEEIQNLYKEGFCFRPKNMRIHGNWSSNEYNMFKSVNVDLSLV